MKKLKVVTVVGTRPEIIRLSQVLLKLDDSESVEHILVFFPPLRGEVVDFYSLEKNHFGIDLVAKEGEIISAVSSGNVIISDWTKESGFVIGIQHQNGFLSFYKHNSKLLKSVGDFVNTGDPIAIIGNSGELTSGPHLHFELWRNGESLDPLNYIYFQL